MSETTYTPKVGDRVKFLGVSTTAPERTENDIHAEAGAWKVLTPGLYGTVDQVIEDDDKDTKIFVIFDEVEMPLAFLAEILNQSPGWPILASEVEPLDAEAAA